MSHISGPLYAEVMGPPEAPPMVFLHPNPMDNACWMYQMAHFSTWYRCIGIDLPGYGRSPGAAAGVTMTEIAQACWDVIDRESSTGRAVLVGCSVGSYLVRHMYHLRPDATDAIVMSGAGWRPVKDYALERIEAYGEHGVAFRARHARQGLSAEFAETPLASWLVDLFMERNDSADADSIIAMFAALAEPDPEGLHETLDAPVLIVTGTEDVAHASAFALRDLLPNAELVAVPGAGHTCHFEQPWVFDAETIRFLREHGHDQLPATHRTEALDVS